MRVRFEVFRGTLITWDELFEQAAAFASQIGSEWLISISHSADRGEGVVTVWYWAADEGREPAA
jgi:hypothetical protein